MLTTKRFITILLCALLSAPATLAQNPQRNDQTNNSVSQDVLIIIQQQQVRFTAQKAVQEMQLQVFNQAGEMVHDSGVIYGPEINWPFQNANGESLKSGLYAYTLSIKEQGAEAARVRRGHFIVDRAAEQDGRTDRLWITSQNDNGVGTELTVAKDNDATIAGVSIASDRRSKLERDATGHTTDKAEEIPPGSDNYIQNGTTQQASANFNISGNGAVGGNLTADGQVGIGTTTPLGKVQVTTANDTNPFTIAWDARHFVVGGIANTGGIGMSYDQTNGIGYIHALSPNVAWRKLVLQYDGGNVGIGTNAPLGKVQVATANDTNPLTTAWDARHFVVGGIANTGGIGMSYDQANGIGYIHALSPNVAWRKLVLQYDGGNVGIGTNAPLGKVQVATANDTNPLTTAWDARHFVVGGIANTGGIGMSYDQTNGIGYIHALSPNVAWRKLVLQYDGGNVGIGTANPQAKLDVAGQTRTHSLQITGGADFSENFDVNVAPASDEAATPRIEAGLVVSIDPENAGKLALSTRAYDRRVAGIISGAGGVQPGMIMSQEGTLADGKHPVALSGRVYCWVDATNGSIEPGDLLTTSSTPGHAMKVSDPAKAQGAIIGKAMTGLKEGKGLVLVLVTLQ